NHVQTYRFGQTVHALKKVKPPMTENQHKRWHAAKKRILCPFCFPPKSTGEADETIKTESFAVPQAKTATTPAGTPAGNHPPGGGNDSEKLHQQEEVRELLPPTVVVVPDEDIEILAARLRKKFRNEQL